ncbi:MAG: hypothetical protein AAFV53_02145 [Myxococcota bacterium]
MVADRHPEIHDGCDGIDNNCDGEIDPPPIAWYPDVDQDGYGDPAHRIDHCATVDGYILQTKTAMVSATPAAV